MADLQKLIDIMARLRGEDGCPWDRVQTRDSLKPYLLEETYELLEALDEGDPSKIREELGDLLLQIVFQTQIAKDRGEFDMGDVVDTICEKLIARHPHVFGGAVFETPEEVSRQWLERKREEGKLRESVLEGVPAHLPALLRAHRIQSRAAKVGFDWDALEGVIGKVEEEIAELKQALRSDDSARIEDELGDLFFALVNVSRFVKVNPEDALRKTIVRFISRFRHIETRAAEMGRNLRDMTLEEMDALWEEAKRNRRT
jgi:tetrapyrrole methylase family protein/MazG family protein